MDIQIERILDLKETPAAGRGQATLLLERARWAAESFRRYDREATLRIAEAVAVAAREKAGHFAEWAVKETGFGVVEHKKLKNELTSLSFLEHYRDQDFVNPRIDPARKLIEIPKPAGVVMALTPSTNPIATINVKVLSCLLTRNAVVFSPHPAARECSIAAIRHLAEAAAVAGAPEAVIQVVERPTTLEIEELMRSPMTDVILATGGIAMVRAACSSSTPAIGVGPGNAPALVDTSADLERAAERIVESKSFDNSILCTNESVVITLEACAQALKRELEQAGAHLASEAETEALRRFLFPESGFNVEAIGRDAAWIAREAGLRGQARNTGHPGRDRADWRRRAALAGKALPGPGLLRRRQQGAGDRPVAGTSAVRRPRPLGGHPQPGPAHDPRLRECGRSRAGRRQRALQPGGGRLRHASGAQLHHRHGLLRQKLDRAQYRAGRPRAVDVGRLQRRSSRAHGRFQRHADAFRRSPAGSALGRRARQVAAGHPTRGRSIRPTPSLARRSGGSSSASGAILCRARHHNEGGRRPTSSWSTIG
jgi:hypothetical protein